MLSSIEHKSEGKKGGSKPTTDMRSFENFNVNVMQQKFELLLASFDWFLLKKDVLQYVFV